MQTPDQTPTGQPTFRGSGPGFDFDSAFDHPGYGTQPLPTQPVAPPYGSTAPPYGYAAPPYGQTASAPQTSGYAIASLVCSIASWFLVPFIGGVLGVVFGHIARGEIRRSQGWKSGNGLALSGLIIAYIHLVVVIVAVAFIVLLALAFASDGYRS